LCFASSLKGGAEAVLAKTSHTQTLTLGTLFTALSYLCSHIALNIPKGSPH
jgi:hypothetical protein